MVAPIEVVVRVKHGSAFLDGSRLENLLLELCHNGVVHLLVSHVVHVSEVHV